MYVVTSSAASLKHSEEPLACVVCLRACYVGGMDQAGWRYSTVLFVLTLGCSDGSGPAAPAGGDASLEGPAEDALRPDAEAPVVVTPSVPALWSRSLNAQYALQVSSVAVDVQGDIVAAGNFIERLDFGSERTLWAGERGIFVIKLSHEGKLIWSVPFYTKTGQGHATIDEQGEVVVAGYFSEALTHEDASLVARGDGDAFVAKLTADGKLVWIKQIASPQDESIGALATGPDGEIVVAGLMLESLEFDGIGARKIVGTVKDAFVAKLDTDGNGRWINNYDSVIRAVGMDADSRVYLAGFFWGALDLGDELRVVAAPPSAEPNRADAFLAALNRDGSPRFIRGFGGPQGAAAVAIAVDSNRGGVSLAGHCNGAAQFPTGTFDCGEVGAYAAQWNRDGDPLWTRGFPAQPGWNFAEAIAVTSGSEVVVGGFFSGLLEVGELSITGDFTQDDVFVVRFDRAGAPHWVRRYGEVDVSEEIVALAVDPTDGAVVVVGSYVGSVDFGNGPLPDAGDSPDVFIAKLPP